MHLTTMQVTNKYVIRVKKRGAATPRPELLVAEINHCLLKSSFFFQQPFLFAYFLLHIYIYIIYIYIYMNGALHLWNL